MRSTFILPPLLLCTACGPSSAPSVAEPSVEQVTLTVVPAHYQGRSACPTGGDTLVDLQLWGFGGCLMMDRCAMDPEQDAIRWGRWRSDDQGGVEVSLSGGTVIRHFRPTGDGALTADGDPVGTLELVPGQLIPRLVRSAKGTFYQPRPRVWHFRECASGREFLVRFAPQAADIESAFEEAGGEPAQGLVVELGGSLAPTGLDDEQGQVVLMTIEHWARFFPKERCPN
ncbi:MAG: hypothetical protein H6595_09350 [Flavobacteriales bacterium]|nr:hypothetical protein [Flavobacteriales bacterium]MCB9167669.1 hypothetical protein [Flavobacteriales bacterium]